MALCPIQQWMRENPTALSSLVRGEGLRSLGKFLWQCRWDGFVIKIVEVIAKCFPSVQNYLEDLYQRQAINALENYKGKVLHQLYSHLPLPEDQACQLLAKKLFASPSFPYFFSVKEPEVSTDNTLLALFSFAQAHGRSALHRIQRVIFQWHQELLKGNTLGQAYFEERIVKQIKNLTKLEHLLSRLKKVLPERNFLEVCQFSWVKEEAWEGARSLREEKLLKVLNEETLLMEEVRSQLPLSWTREQNVRLEKGVFSLRYCQIERKELLTELHHRLLDFKVKEQEWVEEKKVAKNRWKNGLKPSHILLQRQLFFETRQALDFATQRKEFVVSESTSQNRVCFLGNPPRAAFKTAQNRDFQEDVAANETLFYQMALFFSGLENVFVPTRRGEWEGKVGSLQLYVKGKRDYPNLANPILGSALLRSPHRREYERQLSLENFWLAGLASLLFANWDLHSHNFFWCDGALKFFDNEYSMEEEERGSFHWYGEKRCIRNVLLEMPHADETLPIPLKKRLARRVSKWKYLGFPRLKAYMDSPFVPGFADPFLQNNGEKKLQRMEQRLQTLFLYLNQDVCLFSFRTLFEEVFPDYVVLDWMEKLLNPRISHDFICYDTFEQVTWKVLNSSTLTTEEKDNVLRVLFSQNILSSRCLSELVLSL